MVFLFHRVQVEHRVVQGHRDQVVLQEQEGHRVVLGQVVQRDLVVHQELQAKTDRQVVREVPEVRGHQDQVDQQDQVEVREVQEVREHLVVLDRQDQVGHLEVVDYREIDIRRIQQHHL